MADFFGWLKRMAAGPRPDDQFPTGPAPAPTPVPNPIAPTTTESESDDAFDYARDQLRLLIWSGCYPPREVRDAALDMVLDGDLAGFEDRLMEYIDEEFYRKAQAEKQWPAVTDCDRLDTVFAGLATTGVFTAHNAGFTMQEGRWEVERAIAEQPAGAYHGFCFYHTQDLHRAVDGTGLYLGFGDLMDDDARTVVVGRQIRQAFEQAGFEVDWDGTADTRINLPAIDWKRRTRR